MLEQAPDSMKSSIFSPSLSIRVDFPLAPCPHRYEYLDWMYHCDIRSYVPSFSVKALIGLSFKFPCVPGPAWLPQSVICHSNPPEKPLRGYSALGL